MMLINNSPTFSPSNNLVTFDEDDQLCQIKNRLLKEVNSFRVRSSLDQFYEDHNITKILQNMNISSPQTLKEEDIVANIQNKLSTSDHQILISTKQFSNYGINKESPMTSLENHFFDIISKMMQVTHKDNFTNKNFTNISLYLGYDCLQVFLVIVFSNNMLSIEKIVSEEDCFQITGKLHNINCSIFILLLKFKDFDAIVISPNKMKFDPVNNIFRIILDKNLIGSNSNFYAPDLEFYVKAGKNSVKYGLGNDISYQEMCRMATFLKMAYVMPFMTIESSIILQENSFFAKSSSAYQNLKNKSVTFTLTPDQQNQQQSTPITKNARSFLNSPIPNFAALNNNFPKTNLSTIREEPMGLSMRGGVTSLFKDNRRGGGGGGNIENKENICRNSTPRDKIYASNKSNGSASSNKMIQERVIDPKTLNFFSSERRYQTLSNTTNANNHLASPNFKAMGDLDSQFRNLNFPFPNQFQRLDYTPNMFENGFKHEDVNNYSCPIQANPFQSNSNYDANNQWTPDYLTANTVSFANNPGPGLFVKNDFCNLPTHGDFPQQLQDPEPFIQQLIIPNKQCVRISDRDFKVLPNHANFKGYNPRESTIDPNNFKKGEVLSEVAKNNLLYLQEKLAADFAFNKVQQYVKLYQQSNEMHDVILTFKNDEEIKAHRVVLLQSPYFERVFQTLKSLPNEPVKILMPEYLRVNSFRKVLRYMYCAEIETHELDTMDLVLGREILLTAYSLRLYGLMSTVLVRVIIPKMDKLMCVELLKDSFEREDKKSKVIWKTLQHYCLNFFALHSKSILNKYSRLLEGIDTKLVYKMINKALTKCSDIQHMYELLSVLVQNGFASNILDILEKVPFIKDKDRKFDTKYLQDIQELLISLDSKSCYVTDLITNKDINQNSKKHFINSILEESKQDSNVMEISAIPLSNHLELNLRHNPDSQEFFEPNEWPEIKKMDPTYEMKMQLASGAKSKSVVSQSFDSDSRSWRLILDIEEDYRVSAFLVEKGNPAHSPFGSPFKNEFTSVKYLIQIQQGDIEYETILFHTFANEHHYSIGHRRFASLPNLAVDNKIQVRVWMMEFPVYSCAIQYISTRFNDLMKATFQDHDISKIITLKPDEKNYLGTKTNNLNQPQYKTGPQLEQKKLKAEAKKRKSMHFLEDNFFQESAPGLSPEKVDPLAAHAVHPVSGIFRQGTEINRIPSMIPEIQQMKTKPKRFQELNSYDFYYLVSSDYLTIEHEKFLIYFLYKFTQDKSEEMVSLISFCLRFSFIELSKLFNAARDLSPVRNNITFIHKLDFEINMRISTHQPFDRPRKFYSADMYQNWNFKDDLLRWLIESDHHQGYRLKIDELKKIIKSKEELLKTQRTTMIDMDSKMQQINTAFSNHIASEGLKKQKLSPFVEEAFLKKSQQSLQCPNHGVLTLVKDKCNVF